MKTVPPVVLALLCAGVAPGAAQSLDDLKTPSMPAFTVLGVAPIAIERPTTPRALGLSLLSVAGEEGLPDSYAIEVAPYWLTPKPFLSFAERYNASVWQSVLQTFAVSIATAPMAEASVDSVRLGVGFRMLLRPGRTDPGDVKDSLNAVQRRITFLSVQIDTTENDVVAAALRVRRDSLEAITEVLAVDLAQQPDDAALGGLRWELAGGVGSLFPQGEFAGGRVTAFGVWTSIAFRPANTDFDLVGLARFQHLDLGAISPEDEPLSVEGEQDVLDLGGRLLWAVGSFELSGEFIGRFAFDVTRREPGSADIQYDNTYQAAGALKYAISNNLAIRWALGRGFELQGADAGSLIADLGLQIGLGPEIALPF